ncbi:MAG TPA: hypothetical protein VF221_00190 [Chloroflexota bacterium]
MASWRRTLLFSAAAALLAGAGTAGGLLSTRDSAGISPSVQRGEAGAVNVDWSNPFVDRIARAGVGEAARDLHFPPVAPAELGHPLAVFVHAQVSAPDQQALALVYQSSTYGRFIVQEEPMPMTQAQLESLAQTCQPVSCEGSWTIVTLPDGTRALLISSSASNGVLWLRNGVRFDVYGPPDTFTVADAEVIATKLSSLWPSLVGSQPPS